MVPSVVALSDCEVWASFTSVDTAISSDSPGAVKIRKVVGRSEIFYAEIIARSSAERIWSAPAERSGDGALDSLGRQNQY